LTWNKPSVSGELCIISASPTSTDNLGHIIDPYKNIIDFGFFWCNFELADKCYFLSNTKGFREIL